MNDAGTLVLERRYLKKDAQGQVCETPADMFRRVAKNIAAVDKHYGADDTDVDNTADLFFHLMNDHIFLPNSPTLRGAGRALQQLSGCFVLPIGDSMEDIFDALKYNAMIHKTGGGVGINYTPLRPKGARVGSTGNCAGGPVSFMKLFNYASAEITQAGVRMGANIGILEYTHPDIIEFITCKIQDGSLANFNISVALDEHFWTALEQRGQITLTHAHGSTKTIDATTLFDQLCTQAHHNGDPGVLFLDNINSTNPSWDKPIDSTNPCGEQVLQHYESCNLGSINLSKFVRHPYTPQAAFDYAAFEDVVVHAIHFLDNVVDANKYPLPIIESETKKRRRIGLGLMGFADTLIMLGLPYDRKANRFVKLLGEHFQATANQASQILGGIRGPYPLGMEHTTKRNIACTTIAPTGTISLIAGCSSGIEPLFSLAYKRGTLYTKEGASEVVDMVNPHVAHLIDDPEVLQHIQRTGSVQSVQVNERLKLLLRTANEIPWDIHLRVQAEFQRYVQNSISKTINLPPSASVEDVKQIYTLAHQWGCKGVTVYRAGSHRNEVIRAPESPQVRPDVYEGETIRVQSPVGRVYVTLNHHDGQPIELFVNAAKAGSDTAATTEAIGRLGSFILQLPSSIPRAERLQEIAHQLHGLGGTSRSGFGPHAVLSLPDAIAHGLQHLGEYDPPKTNGNLCPDCHNYTMITADGCSHCTNCGYSKC